MSRKDVHPLHLKWCQCLRSSEYAILCNFKSLSQTAVDKLAELKMTKLHRISKNYKSMSIISESLIVDIHANELFREILESSGQRFTEN